MKLKRCLNCNIVFDRPLRTRGGQFKISWVSYSKRKFCSNKCRGEWRSKNITGKNNWNWRGGKNKCIDCGKELPVRYHYSRNVRCRECYHKFNKNENLSCWKGDDVSYIGIHSWVKKRFPKPIKCSICGKVGKYIFFKYKTGKSGKTWTIHIANKSGKYKRCLSDWFGLCAKCHKIYDTKRLKQG